MGGLSPVLLLVIVIVAILIFVFGLLQLLLRCLIKRTSFPSISQSNRFPDASNPHTIQRQLQQLFRLHDSGLDQPLIDALPVFYYEDIMGLKEPFDCAVCLCEFSESDKLKLIPNCSHAFHIHCIETWLLSNSTCPLCRSVIGSGMLFGSPLSNFDELIEQWNLSCPDVENEHSTSSRRLGGNGGSGRVFSVRLGKFRNLNQGLETEDRNRIEVSSSNLDARRCYSMGEFQYVVGDKELQVALSNGNRDVLKTRARCSKDQAGKNEELIGKKINARSRGDSFSVSKIWLWSKKSRFRDGNEDVILSIPNRSDLV